MIGLTFLNDLFRSYDATASRFLYRLSGPLVAIQVISYLAIASIAIGAVWLWFQRRREADRVTWHNTLWIVGLIPLGIGFFAWNGVLGVQARLLQLGTLLAMCCAAILLVVGRRFGRQIAVAGIATAVVCTLITVPHVHLGENALISEDEWEALQWYEEEIGCDSVLFTDFRIGTAATYLGCFKVIGPTAGTLSRAGRAEVLSDLYFTGEPADINDAISSMSTTQNEMASYVLLSEAMRDPNVGPMLPDGRLRPMSDATWNAYYAMADWILAYRNDSVSILSRAGPQARDGEP